MPLPVIANTYRVALDYTDSATGQSATNVIHVRQASTDAIAIAGVVDAAAAINVMYQAPATASLEQIKCTPLDGSGSTHTRIPTNAHWVGGSSGDFIPGASVVVSYGTDLRGRSHRGRIYLPFVCESLQGDGSISSGTATIIREAWEATSGAIIAAGAAQVIASYKLASAADITSWLVLTGLGTQRRRQTRVRYP
jgi:hypothetical protein